MYIKLGDINTKKSETTYSDYYIISEVVDSSMSYEEPVLVHTPEELKLWFGSEFSDYYYFCELLKDPDVALYLYKPLSSKNDSDTTGYVDYESWLNSGKVVFCQKQSDLPGEGERNKVYIVRNDETGGQVYVDDKGISYRCDYYIWYTDLDTLKADYYNTEALPQQDQINSDSINNRDTLTLTYDSNIKYLYPEYLETSSNYDLMNNLGEISITSDDLQDIDSGKKILVTINDFSDYYKRDSTLFESYFYTTDSGVHIYNYLYMPGFNKDSETINFLFIWTREDENNLLPNEIKIGDDERYEFLLNTPDIIKDKQQEFPNKESLDKAIDRENRIVVIAKKDGEKWIVDNENSKYFNNNTTYIYSFHNVSDITDVLGSVVDKKSYGTISENDEIQKLITFKYTPQFVSDYSSPVFGITSKGSKRLSWDLIYFNKKDSSRVDFWSKTIGTTEDAENNPISVKIELLDFPNYRFTISRYSYSEVFEGPIFFGYGREQRIDYQISNESKLVYCDIDNSGISEDPEIDTNNTRFLPTGTFYLRGATIEEDDTNYSKGLNELFSKEDIQSDFLLIPDPSKFNLSEILDYCKTYDMQALIQNDDSNYKNNLVDDDKDNRLIYFYQSILFGDGLSERPGYYLFLEGLRNNIYSPSTRDIYYPSPDSIDDNYYIQSDLGKELESYKSNYLVDNNQIYYYPKFFWGKDFKSTGWLRFILSKVSRQLIRNKSNFIGEKTSSISESMLSGILQEIANRYSGIVREITIDHFYISEKDQKLSSTITISMSDLVDKNITLDITINFN